MTASKQSESRLAGTVMAALILTSASANAEEEITADHISSGSAIGKLMVVDVPHTTSFPVTGGPTWGGDLADDGFKTELTGILETWGVDTGRWEPDGTPASDNDALATYGNLNPGVSFTFAIPDGAIIHAVYATWTVRQNGAQYQYSEIGTGDVSLPHNVEPLNDLGLDWTDAGGFVHTAPFQSLFSAPIIVAGGDGFTLIVSDTVANAASIDAVVIDVFTPLGTNYCLGAANSVGTGASISAMGSDSVSANDLVLRSTNVPNQPGLFFYGATQVQLPFGHGFLCVASPVNLIYPPVYGSLNEALCSVDYPSLPAGAPITPGSTWNFQHWYRDPAMGAPAFNASDALSITFTP